jgi:hypothetical protein
VATLKQQAVQDGSPTSLDERQKAIAELLFKRGWADVPPKSGMDSAKPWGEFRSKEELLAALPPLPPYEPPDSDK